MDEQPRPDANGDEQAYTLTIEDALHRYDAAGHPRTPRAIQKYCARGDLECVKEETEFGQRYRITPASVARHLAQIEEIKQTKVREQTRTDAAVRTVETEAPIEENKETNVREQTRMDANVRPEPEAGDSSRTAANDTRYIEQIEKENAYLREQNDKKDKQLERRDTQIEAMIQRDAETNVLIQGLQKLIPQLAPGKREEEPSQS